MPQHKVTAEPYLNIRSAPGAEFDDWGDLPNGSIVEELDTAGWCPILLEDNTVGWISRAYLSPAPEGEEIPAPVPPVQGEPAWITWAKKHLGQKEVPGPASNPVIEAWYRLTTLPKSYWTDSTAWCAVFVNAALMLNNIKTIRSARAFDWLKWGKEVIRPEKGDVVVFSFSHVAFYLEDAGNRIKVIGGNQNDAVTVTTYAKPTIVGYRRAA